MKMEKRLRVIIAIVTLFFVLWPQSAVRAETEFKVEEGWTLAFSGGWTQLFGSLDGGSLSGIPEGSIRLSDPEAGLSYGIALGGRGPSGALSLGYSLAELDDVVMADARTSKLEIIDLNATVFLWSLQRLQPFLTFGVNFPRLTLKDAASLGSERVNARLDGYGIHAGLGLAYYFTPRFSISLDGLFRHMRFDTIKGLSGSGSFKQNLTIQSLSAGTGLSYTF